MASASTTNLPSGDMGFVFGSNTLPAAAATETSLLRNYVRVEMMRKENQISHEDGSFSVNFKKPDGVTESDQMVMEMMERGNLKFEKDGCVSMKFDGVTAFHFMESSLKESGAALEISEISEPPLPRNDWESVARKIILFHNAKTDKIFTGDKVKVGLVKVYPLAGLLETDLTKLFEMKRFCRISRSYELPEGVKQQVGELKTKTVEEEDRILNVTVTFNKANTSDLSSRNGLQTVLNKVIAFLNAQMHWEVFQGKHVFRAYLPAGMRKEDVSIEIEDDSKELRIIKQLDMEEGVTIPDWLLEEFSDGKISRSFKLPKVVNPKHFKTDETADGILTVTFTQINNKPKKQLMSKLLRLLSKAASFNKLKHPKKKNSSHTYWVF